MLIPVWWWCGLGRQCTVNSNISDQIKILGFGDSLLAAKLAFIAFRIRAHWWHEILRVSLSHHKRTPCLQLSFQWWDQPMSMPRLIFKHTLLSLCIYSVDICRTNRNKNGTCGARKIHSESLSWTNLVGRLCLFKHLSPTLSPSVQSLYPSASLLTPTITLSRAKCSSGGFNVGLIWPVEFNVDFF